MEKDEALADDEGINHAYITEFLGEVLNMAILDSGCTQTVCGKAWLEVFQDSLPTEKNAKVSLVPSERTFKFGDGMLVKSLGKVLLPVSLKGVNGEILIETDVIDKDLPLLMSRGSMKRANTVISFNNQGKEQVVMFGQQQNLYVSKSGHLCIPLSINNLDFHSGDEVAAHILFTGDITELTKTQKSKVANKLHKQFAHPASSKLIKLLKDGGVDDPVLHKLIEEITEKCDICTKFKKKQLTPAVCFPRATEFNENIAVDLKSFTSKYMLHIIDHFTRFSRGVVINNKEADTIVDGLIRGWVAIFGPPDFVLSDNGREFDNEKFKETAEKFNISVTSTAAESPWSNGMNERHNGILGEMVEKLVADGHSLVNAVCWAVSAKNSLANVSGYSPSQLALGRNPQLPSILSSKAPALEACRYQDVLYKNLKAMTEARECFVKFEADERLKRALKKKTRSQVSEKLFEIGSKVYFERLGQWRGPGTIIGLENKDVLVKQGGTIYRVPPCRLNPIHEELENTNKTCQNSENSSPVVSDQPIASGSAEKMPVVSEELSDENSAVEVQSSVQHEVENSVNLGEPAVSDSATTSGRTHAIDKSFTGSTKPNLKSLVNCRISNDADNWRLLRIVRRGGRVGGRNENWFNVYDASEEDGTIFSVNWDEVEEWSPVEEEICMSVSANRDPDIVEAKEAELQKWIDFEVYNEVEDTGQEYVTTQWVITQKHSDSGRIVKARLVAHGFQERGPIQKDSPTALKESIRLLLIMAISTGYTINTLDVKSAFLQGDPINRSVFLRPPKEANSQKLWRLNKCVYGLKDASRLWYLRVYNVLVDEFKMQNLRLDEAMFIWKPGDKVEGLICIHVDDVIWIGSRRFHDTVILKFVKTFKISQQSHGFFTYLGLNISQQKDKITVDQQQYIDSLSDLDVDCSTRQRDIPLDSSEKSLVKKYAGKIAWAANHTRPDVAFEACNASVGISTSTVGDALKIRKAYRKIKSLAFNISFVKLQNVYNCELWVFSDAAHANLKNEASQLGYVILLVDERGTTNLIKWNSKKISRVVKSSLAAETLALLEAADNAFYIQKLLESITCVPDSNQIRCFTDNMSIVEHISTTTCNLSDFRLRVDMSCLRDMVKRKEIYSLTWVDKRYQIADCLTKSTASSKNLMDILQNNKIDRTTYLRM